MSRKIIGVTVGTTMNPKRIAEKIEDATSLPVVTEDDDGKVLKAHGGKWTAQEEEEPESLSNLDIEEILKNFK